MPSLTPRFAALVRRFAAAFALACVCLPAHTQAPRRELPFSQTNATQPTATLKVSVRQVVFDITVTDAKGKPVPGLTASDFHIAEDGAPQTLRSFDVHTAESQPPLKAPALPANTFSNFASSPAGGPTTVILYDLLNTPLDSQAYAHAQLLDFLKQRKQSGQVAIFVLSDKLHMLQGFTDDDNKLIAALNVQKAKGYRSGLIQSSNEATQQSDLITQTDGNQNGADARQDISFQAVSSMLKHMESVESSYLLDRRVDLTAQALQQIARFLIALPGRKNLLWLSAAFPDGIIPNSAVDGRNPTTGRDEFINTRNYSSEIVQATAMLNLSHVAVYPVDVRGLQVNGMFSAASTQTFEPGQGKDLQAARNFSQRLTAEHATMDTIGNETGGRAFYNTNGLKDAAAEAIQEGSLYYTLSYSPTNRTYDKKLRTVHVELTQPGYQLAYRRSYFTNGMDEVVRNREDNPTDVMAIALEHGAPAAHELFFEAHVTPQGSPVPASSAQMAELAKYEAMATKSKRLQEQQFKTPILLQQYLISYGLLPRQIDLSLSPDQTRRGTLEFAAISYNDDGLTLNGTRTRIDDVITPDRYALMEQSGYHMLQSIFVPVQARSIRLAVRDASNDHIGSLEIGLPLPPDPKSDNSLPARPTIP